MIQVGYGDSQPLHQTIDPALLIDGKLQMALNTDLLPLQPVNHVHARRLMSLNDEVQHTNKPVKHALACFNTIEQTIFIWMTKLN